MAAQSWPTPRFISAQQMFQEKKFTYLKVQYVRILVGKIKKLTTICQQKGNYHVEEVSTEVSMLTSKPWPGLSWCKSPVLVV